MIGMNELLVGLCSYMALKSDGDTACRTTVNQAYNVSIVKPYIDHNQSHLEKEGAALYNPLPLPVRATSFLIYDTYRKDFKIPLTNNVNMEYNDFNKYTCNLKWSW